MMKKGLVICGYIYNQKMCQKKEFIDLFLFFSISNGKKII